MQKKISFYKNGKDLGPAYNGIKIDGSLSPAASVYRGTVFEFNFTRKWTYPVKGVNPLQFSLPPNELKNLTAVFDKYHAIGVKLSESGNTGDHIKGLGIMQLSQDLGSKGDLDPLLLILAWKLGCKVVWEISKDEFITGFSLAGVSSFEQIKHKTEEWRKEIKDENQFKTFYFFIFEYLKPEKATAMDKEEAMMAWKMLTMKDRWVLWDKWEKFLVDATEKKSITRDTWQMLITFIEQVGSKVENYDSMDCWPVYIDDFVEHLKHTKE